MQVAQAGWLLWPPHEASRTRSDRGSPLAVRAELTYGPTKLKAHGICHSAQTVRRSRRWAFQRPHVKSRIFNRNVTAMTFRTLGATHGKSGVCREIEFERSSAFRESVGLVY